MFYRCLELNLKEAVHKGARLDRRKVHKFNQTKLKLYKQ